MLGQLAGMEAERRRKGEQEGERERRKQERAQGLRRRRWWWERVLRDWGERPGQQPREAGCWELPRTPNGHQQGNAGGGDDATEVIAISGMLPKLSNFSKVRKQATRRQYSRRAQGRVCCVPVRAYSAAQGKRISKRIAVDISSPLPAGPMGACALGAWAPPGRTALHACVEMLHSRSCLRVHVLPVRTWTTVLPHHHFQHTRSAPPYYSAHMSPPQEAIQTHLPLLLDDSPLSDSSLNEDDGMDFEATATGASSSSSPLASRPPGPWSPARHDVPVHWVEAVVALLPHTDLLPYQITSTQHLRCVCSMRDADRATHQVLRRKGKNQ